MTAPAHTERARTPAALALRRACCAAAAVVVALAAASTSAQAQRLFGTVVLADGKTPGVGAIVAVADSSNAIVGREMASVRGDYIIPLPHAGKFTVTTWRVGSVPTVTRGVDVAPARDVRLRIVLEHTVERPAAVTARAGETCAVLADDAGVSALWNQFQVALTTTALAEATGAFSASWEYSERVIDGNLRDTISKSASTERMPLGAPPMPSIPADSSARFGFAIETAQGVLYNAPSIATMRSRAFATHRCFAFEPAPPDHPGWIGVHFRPEAQRSGLSDIEGNVWFDLATLEPQRFEFLYLGLPPTFGPAKSGGSASFRRLPTGHWIADEWTIRVPSGRYFRMFAYDTRGVPSGYGSLTLDGVRVTTARLGELQANGATIYRRPQ